MSLTYYRDDQVTLFHGDALQVAVTIQDASIDCIVTSPPYFGLRDYGKEGQYGLEESPAEYIDHLRALFSELRRVLADDGTLWLNIGDSYAANIRSDNRTSEQRAKSSTLGRPEQNGLGGGNSAHRSVSFPPRRMDCGVPQKNLLGIPWRVAFALQDDGWILRNAIIWNKPNAMPESVTDRLSGRYEHVFLFSKSRRYWFDLDPIRDTGPRLGHRKGLGLSWAERQAASSLPGASRQRGLDPGKTDMFKELSVNPEGRNPGDVWEIPTSPFAAAHFAVMPVKLAQRCILAGCKPGGTVLDPFSGSGTTGLAAQRTGRKYVGIDLNAAYHDLALKYRLGQSALNFEEPA